MVKEVCDGCNERVFLIERLCAEGHVYHRTCFSCSRCGQVLQSKSYEYDIHNDKFYCRQHFQEMNRNLSIKRNMIARGVTNFDEKELVVLETKSEDKKKQEDEWDIIQTPPPTVTQAPSIDAAIDEAQNQKDKQMKMELPSLLSALAQKKKVEQNETEPEPHPPQATSKNPILPSQKLVAKSTCTNKIEKNEPKKIEPVNNKLKKDKPIKEDEVKKVKDGEEISKESPSLSSPALSPDKKRNNNAQKPRPPKPFRTGSKRGKTTTVLEHYEFSRQYYEENNEAKEVLETRYDFGETHKNINRPLLPQEPSPTGDGNPYEVPITKPRSQSELQVTQPEKPARIKRGAPNFVTVHKGDTWVKPYAISPIHKNGDEDKEKALKDKDNNKPPVKPAIVQAKPKPARPAPPLPFAVNKSKPMSVVSPYAVSNVTGLSSATSKLLGSNNVVICTCIYQYCEFSSSRTCVLASTNVFTVLKTTVFQEIFNSKKKIQNINFQSI